LNFLASPSSLTALDDEGWSLLLAEARAADLLSRIAEQIHAFPCPTMPDKVQPHILSARRQGESLSLDVKRELILVADSLKSVNARKILLKGAAYVTADLPAARGRIFSDIDLLVSRSHLPEAEGALMLGGWAAAHVDAYDQRYYREWAHEIPPMTHLQRGTTIDLHHSLVMPTCNIRVDTERMIGDAVPIPGEGNWFRLRNEDIVLHAASHLMLNSEFSHGLRDLGDIDILLRHFGSADSNFTDNVKARALEIGLGEIAEQAFTLCHRFYGTRLPQGSRLDGGFLIRLLANAAITRHPDTRPRWQPTADLLLLLRELSLRLPPRLLVKHLVHKSKVALSPKPPVTP
jgi:hypothetical protein